MIVPPWQTFTARFNAVDMTGDGSEARSYVTVEIETPLVWADGGIIVLPITKSRYTVGGVADFLLPLPGQLGFTAGAGGAAITNWAYRFWAQPTRSGPIISDTFVTIPAETVPGGRVDIGNLINVGAWPNQTVVTGGGAAATGYVPVLVSGNSGYWSPA